MISLPYHTNLPDNAIKCFILYYSDEENESQRDMQSIGNGTAGKW